MPDAKGVVSMLRRRVGDEKVNVRKVALHSLEVIIKLQGAEFDKEVNVEGSGSRVVYSYTCSSFQPF